MSKNKVTKIFHNANVLTVDAVNTIAQAVAITGDRILKVGMNKDILALADSDTVIVDLQKKTLIPGFYDPHGHFFYDSETQATSVDLNSAPIGTCQTFADCFVALKERVAETPKGDWVVGYGFDDTMIAEKDFFTRHHLDELSTEHPILVRHISGHLGVLNTLGLEKFAYNKDTKDPEGGVIRREEDGITPNGVIEETAILASFQIIPPLGHDALKEAIIKHGYRHASYGITTTIEAGVVNKPHVVAIQEAIAEKKMPIRLFMNMFENKFEEFRNEPCNDYLQVGGIKLLQDGSIQGYTAYLSKPYHTPQPSSNDPEWRGYPIHTPEELFNKIRHYHEQDIQIIVHTNGDQATEDVLNAFEKALEEYPRFDHRCLVIHAQMAREDQLDRFKKLGMTPSFFTAHEYYWGDRHKALFLGPERAERQNPMQSAIKRGIICTGHNDAPITPTDPLLVMWIAVNRLSSTGQLMGEDQRISAIEALRACTYNPAWQNFEEKEKGSIEAGKFADLVVLEEDPTTCDPMHIRNINILATYVGGEAVYQK